MVQVRTFGAYSNPMKKLLLPLAIVAIFVALYEQSKDRPNVYVMCAAIVIFMVGVMNLGSKIKSKKHEDDQGDTPTGR